MESISPEGCVWPPLLMAVSAQWHDLYIEQVRSVLPPCADPLERVDIDKKKEKSADLAIDIVVSYNKLSIVHFRS